MFLYFLWVKMVSILRAEILIFCFPSSLIFLLFSLPSLPFLFFLLYFLVSVSSSLLCFLPIPLPCLLCFPLTDSCDSDFELSMVRHQPEGLDQLQAQTQFTRKELQSLYRGFKNVWKQSAWSDACGYPNAFSMALNWKGWASLFVIIVVRYSFCDYTFSYL